MAIFDDSTSLFDRWQRAADPFRPPIGGIHPGALPPGSPTIAKATGMVGTNSSGASIGPALDDAPDRPRELLDAPTCAGVQWGGCEQDHDLSCAPPPLRAQRYLPRSDLYERHVVVGVDREVSVGLDEEYKAALRQIWAMLSASRDLLEWAMCRVGIGDNVIESILTTLEARGRRRIQIKLAQLGPVARWDPNGFSFPWEERPGRIRIAADDGSPWLIHFERLYLRGNETQKIAFCIAFATQVAHEMLHHYGLVIHGFGGTLQPCDPIYRVQNAHAFALLSRYGIPEREPFGTIFFCSHNWGVTQRILNETP